MLPKSTFPKQAREVHIMILRKSFFLAISDFIMFPQKKNYKSDHVMLDKESHENDLKRFFVYFPGASKIQ